MKVKNVIDFLQTGNEELKNRSKRIDKCCNMHEELISALFNLSVGVEHLKPEELSEHIKKAKELIKQDQEFIWIDGYYLDGKGGKEGEDGNFSGYKCVMGYWDGDECDHDIFYYFESEKDLQSMMETENRTDTEFVVTKVER